jgi:hypothetical protein
MQEIEQCVHFLPDAYPRDGMILLCHKKRRALIFFIAIFWNILDYVQSLAMDIPASVYKYREAGL